MEMNQKCTCNVESEPTITELGVLRVEHKLLMEMGGWSLESTGSDVGFYADGMAAVVQGIIDELRGTGNNQNDKE